MKYANSSNYGVFYPKQPDFRKESIDILKDYLLDPGRFSILVLGERGTGKSFWIKELCNEYSTSDCLSGIVQVNGLIARNTDEKFWEEKFTEAENKILVIDDVEELSPLTQAILFEFLSTVDGKYGLKEKKHQCRIVFTSSLSIEKLREEVGSSLLYKFFDRISQLVVRFDSIKDKNTSIWNDFNLTWTEIMKFPEDKMPGDDFKRWMELNHFKLHGNLRDLDKLAINWRNCQLIKMKKGEILEKVTKNFISLFRNPEQKSKNENTFLIDEDMDYKNEIEPKFKKFVKAFAKRKYGGKLSNAPNKKPLGISYRTMEAW